MTSAPADDRHERERAFHDTRYEDDSARAGAAKFYDVTAASRDAYLAAVAAPPGARVLEYGCGRGSAAFDLAAAGAIVTGIDISPVAIETARDEAAARGVAARATFEVMNAESLTFPDASFDLVCGTGILHHLDLAVALAEVARVLRPDGRAVFLEPLGHNPLINWYRARTPAMRSEDEHPLVVADLQSASRWFGDASWRCFHLTTLAAVAARRWRGQARVTHVLDRVDRALFRVLPRLEKHAWVALMELARPRA